MFSRRHAAPKAFEGTLVIDSNETINGHEGWRTRFKGEFGSIALLLFLYTLQGVPLGLAASVPLILQEKNISYKEQALFSLVSWPFSLKLLWAPLVDSIYSSSFGRRKSWLVPVQLGIGILLIALSSLIPQLIGDTEPPVKPDVMSLTIFFGILYGLAATQDIAVDGWALTMLSRKNVGMASTCNTIGQMVGYLVAFVVFLALNSEDFCNRWIRSEPQAGGVLSLPLFMAGWGYVFVVSTVLVALLKTERDDLDGDQDALSLKDTYLQMWQLCRLRPFISLIIVMLTGKIGFAAADAITTLKLVEKGVPKVTMGTLAVAVTPLNVIATAYISHHTSGPRPLTLFMRAYPFRLGMGLVFVYLVWLAPTTTHTIGWGYFTLVVLATAVHQMASTIMFVAQISFFAKVSDPAIGGTSMTLLNTVTNLGSKWPQTVALGVVDYFAVRICHDSSGSTMMTCSSNAGLASCTEAGGQCHTYIDGFTALSVICAVAGVIWMLLFGHKTLALQDIDEQDWMLSNTKRKA